MIEGKIPEEVTSLPPPEKLKVLFFDVETAPNLAYVWNVWKTTVQPEGLVRGTFLLSWAAKWRDGKRIFSEVLDEHEAKEQDDSRIVQSLADLVRSADVVVAHNADKFDVPVLNGCLLRLGLEPLGPIKTIDTLKMARSSFKLAYNRLDYLATYLGVGGKLPTSFSLWVDCYQGDRSALRKMQRYNKNDVTILQAVFEALLPYAKNVSRMVDASYGGQEVCPYCGGRVIRRGYYRTQAETYTKFQCKECQRYSRARRAESRKKTGVHPL